MMSLDGTMSNPSSSFHSDGHAAEQNNGVHVAAGSTTASTSNLSNVERLEYRMPSHTSDNAFSGTSTRVQPLAEEWLHPSAADRSTSDVSANAAEVARRTEEQWRQERAQLEAQFAEQHAASHRAIIAAREEGRREGRQAAEALFAVEREELRHQIVEAMGEFGKQRERYFHSVEREVVRLSLAIAGRVLHRQAQIDPLFLAGAVRVALDKLADTSGVVLRIAPAQVLAWQEMFRLHGGVRMQPEILGDLSLNAGECVLETHLGTVELGVKAQLEEIEKGFFDLLHHHPEAHRMANGLGVPSVS